MKLDITILSFKQTYTSVISLFNIKENEKDAMLDCKLIINISCKLFFLSNRKSEIQVFKEYSPFSSTDAKNNKE